MNTFFVLHVILLTLLLMQWRAAGVLLSPPRFIFFANCVYFFLIYYFFVDTNLPAEIYAGEVTIVFLVSFVITNWLFYRLSFSDGKVPYKKMRIIMHKSSSIYYLYFAVILGGIYISANNLGTFQPLEAFSYAFLETQGREIEAGSFVFILVYTPILWFFYIMALHRAINKKKNFIVLALILSCTYYGAFSGSKSSVILPTIYWLFLYAASIKNLNLGPGKYQSSKSLMLDLGSLRVVLLTVFISLSVGYLLVILNQMRSIYIGNVDFLTAFLARIDYIPTLAGYLSKYESFSSQWPLQEFIKNFIPSSLAKLIDIEKHRISFDVLYTQFAYSDFRISSSAGVGIAAINETLKPLGLSFPYFSAFMAGALSAYFTAFTDRLLAAERMRQGIFWFACIVPSLHIIAFFEPGPTLFFRFTFSVMILTVVVSPLLILLRILKVRYYYQ